MVENNAEEEAVKEIITAYISGTKPVQRSSKRRKKKSGGGGSLK